MATNNNELLRSLVTSAQDSDFAAQALGDWYTARYNDGITILNDIMSLGTSELTGQDWNDALSTYLQTHDNIYVTMDDGSVQAIDLEDLLKDIHNNEDEGVVLTYDGVDYTAQDILQRYADSVNTLIINSAMIKTMLNDNLKTVTDRATTFYNDVSLKLGELSPNVAAYANSLFQSIQNGPSDDRYSAILAIKNWLGLGTEVTTAFAPDFNGVETSGLSSWAAAANSVKEFGSAVWQGLKKVGSAIDGFFGNIFTKAAKAVVTSVQTVTGIRDAFGVNNEGSLYFMDYGRNFRITRSAANDILGSSWSDHITPNRYYQFQLPAGLGVIWVDSSDSQYVNCSIYTRPINQQTFVDFFNPALDKSYYDTMYAPDFTSVDSTSSYGHSWYGAYWFNPHRVYQNFNVEDGPDCWGYYAVPSTNNLSIDTWIERFNKVTKSDITNTADWLADDTSMWWSLRAANVINMCYLIMIRHISSNSVTGDTLMQWYDLSNDFYTNSTIADLINGYYDSNSFNSTGSGEWFIRRKSISWSEASVDVRNSDLALLLTGCNHGRIVDLYGFSAGTYVYWDFLITPTLYVLFSQNEFAAYVNSSVLPAGKYYVLSNSKLVKTLAYSIAGATAVGVIALGIFIAVKMRKIARTIRASISAKERQMTAALATLGNGWSASNWSSARDAYSSINKLNKWATLSDSVSNSIYGALTAIPSFIAGRVSAATSKITSQISALLSGGKSLDSNATGTSDTSYLQKIYNSITYIPPEDNSSR